MEQKNQLETATALAAASLNVREIDGVPFLALHKDFSPHSLGSYLSKPARKSGNTNVQDAAGFLAVFKRHRNENSTVIYADRNRAIFEAVFNDHSEAEAGWRDHTCRYTCPKSKEWKTWRENDGRKMSQEQFAHFIEQNLVDITEPNSAAMLEISRELVARKSANFSSSIRLSNGSHQFNYDEEIRGSTKSGNIEVPETFKIGIPVFLNGEGYAIEARLRYRIKENHLEMWYELIRAHDVYEAAFDQIFVHIAAETGMEIISADC